jgi:hypothetical protein
MFGKTSPAGGRALKIGFVGPRSGVVAPFGEGGDFVISEIRKFVAAGIASKGVNHPVQIIDKDNQSDPTRAAEIALALIKSDRVDLMLAASNGDTVNPVSDQCDKNGVPCMTTDCPWQVYFYGQGGIPDKDFDWTYGAGLSTEVWWSPSHPFKSDLTERNSAELCGAYEDQTKRQWTQPLGFRCALFEVALNVLKRTKSIDSPEAIREASAQRTTTRSSGISHGRAIQLRLSPRLR